jgi:hypothetical protein
VPAEKQQEKEEPRKLRVGGGVDAIIGPHVKGTVTSGGGYARFAESTTLVTGAPKYVEDRNEQGSAAIWRRRGFQNAIQGILPPCLAR